MTDTQLLAVCAWCGRWHDADHGWRTTPHPEAEVTHGICPECSDAALAELWAGADPTPPATRRPPVRATG